MVVVQPVCKKIIPNQTFIHLRTYHDFSTGYVGDGKSCKPGITCNDRPCFP